MEIRFQTKEQSNRQRQQDFLNLSGAERIRSFLRLMEQVNKFPTKNKKEYKKDNFLIVLPNQDELGE